MAQGRDAGLRLRRVPEERDQSCREVSRAEVPRFRSHGGDLEHWDYRRNPAQTLDGRCQPPLGDSRVSTSMHGSTRRPRSGAFQNGEKDCQRERGRSHLGGQSRRRDRARRTGRSEEDEGRRRQKITSEGERSKREEAKREKEEKFIEQQPEEEGQRGRRGLSRFQRGKREEEEEQKEKRLQEGRRPSDQHEEPEGSVRRNRIRSQAEDSLESCEESQEADAQGKEQVGELLRRQHHGQPRGLHRRSRRPHRPERDQTASKTRSRTLEFSGREQNERSVERRRWRVDEGRRSHSTSGHEVCKSADECSAWWRPAEGSHDHRFGGGSSATRENGGEHRSPSSATQIVRTDVTGIHLAESGTTGVDTAVFARTQLDGGAGGRTEGAEGRDDLERVKLSESGLQGIPGKQRQERKKRRQGERQGKEEGLRGEQELEGKQEYAPDHYEGENMNALTGTAEKELWEPNAEFTESTMPDADAMEARAVLALRENGLPFRTSTGTEGAATPSPNPTSPMAEKKESLRLTGEGGLGEVFQWVEARVDVFFHRHCKTKPTGKVFPLPTSIPVLLSVINPRDPLLVVVLRLVCVALNSLNGEVVFWGGEVSQFQREILSRIADDCMRVLEWKLNQEPAEWKSFFKVKSIDYKGEEVQTAQPIQWENIRPALPKEVGTVPLESVVELGCRHYVLNFADYLLPEEVQRRVTPPKVMVPPESWDTMCEKLVELGVCRVIAEQDVHHVEGQPLLNGLFGVSKGEFDGPWETRRLIMNLIPLNEICRGIEGDVGTLPSWAGMNAFHLMPSEDLLMSSEDVRCFFYIFRVPLEWHPFLAFNRLISPGVCGVTEGRRYLCSTVLPMGFKNSVALAQHVHRVVLKRAIANSRVLIGSESEIRKDRAFSSQSTLYRVYLDNFDELRKVDSRAASTLEGKVSPLVLGLQEEYLRQGIPRHPKKSVSQQSKAEVQGAVVDGKRGVAYPKPEKILKYCQLAALLLDSGVSTQKQAQVLGGGFVYFSMFRRPLLGCLNALWTFITSFEGLPAFIRKEIPNPVKTEIARMICLVPLAALTFRNHLSEHVTASDASEFGGGVTVSSGLTPAGCLAAGCKVRGDLLEPDDGGGVLTVGLFDGIGALRVAVDVLGWHVVGHVSVECDAAASRVVESKFPNCVFMEKVEMVDERVVRDWACRFGQVALVLLGAGPPCQGVSGLNADRKGALKDLRSCLFTHVPRVCNLLQKAFPWAQVRTLVESVASMDDQDRNIMSKEIGSAPWKVDASQFSLCHRPRFYWIDWEVFDVPGVQVSCVAKNGEVVYHTLETKVALEDVTYLEPGWSRVTKDPLPTFTTARPRAFPGRRPAGLSQCQPHERSRWEQDLHRYPPYQYLDRHMLQNKKGEFRLPSPEEREVILGFPKGYTVNCMGKKDQGTIAHQDKRMTLLGNSWSVTTVAWMVHYLGCMLGFNDSMTPQEVVDRASPGCTRDLSTFLFRPSMKIQRKSPEQGKASQLVQKLCRLVSIKGEDLMIQSTTEDVAKYHRLRASIPARLWKWRTAASWAWKGNKEHINSLELRAVLCALRWRIEKQHKVQIKMVHLVDSQVCLHALSRGRSSSRKLRRTLLRINSLLLATGCQVMWAYVHTKENPAEAPSRRIRKRKWSHA